MGVMVFKGEDAEKKRLYFLRHRTSEVMKPEPLSEEKAKKASSSRKKATK